MAHVLQHPSFTQLVDLVLSIQRIGALPSKQQELDGRQRQVMNELRQIVHKTLRPATDYAYMHSYQELNSLMETYHSVLLNYKNDLVSTGNELDQIITSFDSQIADILQPDRSEEDAAAGRALGAHLMADKPHFLLKQILLEKFGDRILDLQKDVCVKRVKKVLPSAGATLLKEWWNEHFNWPYPSDVEKISLAQASGLEVVQVNNWFINQRKRTWHKLFPRGLPKNKAEAMQVLALRGIAAGGHAM